MNSNCSPQDPGLIYTLIPRLGICDVNQKTHTLQGNSVNETQLLLFSYISEISFILRYRTELCCAMLLPSSKADSSLCQPAQGAI